MRALVLVLLAASTLLSSSAPPRFPHTPDGWQKWESEDGLWAIWLPDGAPTGEQREFFLVAPGNWRDAWLPAWLGGAEVEWDGEFKAGGAEWRGAIADDGDLRGLIAVSGDEWTLAALCVPGDWPLVFNEILKGQGR